MTGPVCEQLSIMTSSLVSQSAYGLDMTHKMTCKENDLLVSGLTNDIAVCLNSEVWYRAEGGCTGEGLCYSVTCSTDYSPAIMYCWPERNTCT